MAQDANSENNTNHLAGLEALAEAANLDPQFLEPRLALAQLLYAGDPVKRAKAIVEFTTQAYVIDPGHRETMLFLAKILGNDACRKEFVRHAKGTYKDDEIDDFIIELRAEPFSKIKDSDGRERKANDRERKENEARAWKTRAAAYSAAERWDRELACHDRVLQLLPEDANTHFNKGLVLRRLDRPTEAIQSFDRALELDPDDADCWYNRGAAFHDRRNFDGAITSYERVVAINPHYAEAWADMGDACEMIEDWEGAIESYSQFIALAPPDSEGRVETAEIRVRMCRARQSRR